MLIFLCVCTSQVIVHQTSQCDCHKVDCAVGCACAQWKGGLRKARMSMHTECACMDTCCSIVRPPRWSQMCLFYGLMCRIGIVFNKLFKTQSTGASSVTIRRVQGIKHAAPLLCAGHMAASCNLGTTAASSYSAVHEGASVCQLPPGTGRCQNSCRRTSASPHLQEKTEECGLHMFAPMSYACTLGSGIGPPVGVIPLSPK